MSEFEDKLNSILGDPGQMGKIANMAKSLMGGGESAEAAPPDIDPKMLGRISELLRQEKSLSANDKRLLEAIKPYLSEKRRGKMDKAIKLASLAGLAEIAMSEFGGDGDV